MALLARLPFLLRQLDERVAIGLVAVDVAALLGEDVSMLEELMQVVRLRLAWRLLHDHLRLLVLKERSNGHIRVLYLILNVSEALVSQLRGQARALPMVRGEREQARLLAMAVVRGRGGWLHEDAAIADALLTLVQHGLSGHVAADKVDPAASNLALKLLDRRVAVAVGPPLLLRFARHVLAWMLVAMEVRRHLIVNDLLEDAAIVVVAQDEAIGAPAVLPAPRHLRGVIAAPAAGLISIRGVSHEVVIWQ